MGSDANNHVAEAVADVSIHAPAWGATSTPTAPSSPSRSFQFTLPRGERQGDQANHPVTHPVSIHAPAWGATRPGDGPRPDPRFQFTLPRGERQAGVSTLSEECEVSIHAPAWGATSAPSSAHCGRGFQFTLPRGERHLSELNAYTLRRFNSRSRVGSDLGVYQILVDDSVSIHAPAWGATHLRPEVEPHRRFQFTLPRGERQYLQRFRRTQPRFNSRSRVGSDIGTAEEMAAQLGFNSRSRVGSDADGAGGVGVLGVSIHAPAWGATRRHQSNRAQTRFQFTLPRGERHPHRRRP